MVGLSGRSRHAVAGTFSDRHRTLQQGWRINLDRDYRSDQSRNIAAYLAAYVCDAAAGAVASASSRCRSDVRIPLEEWLSMHHDHPECERRRLAGMFESGANASRFARTDA